MAEIYASQGHIDQALAVYRKLVERNPAETRYGDRIEELLMLSRAAGENREPAGAAASSRNPADGSDRRHLPRGRAATVTDRVRLRRRGRGWGVTPVAAPPGSSSTQSRSWWSWRQ